MTQRYKSNLLHVAIAVCLAALALLYAGRTADGSPRTAPEPPRAAP